LPHYLQKFKIKKMSKFKTNYRIKSITTNEYSMPSIGKTLKMKSLELERMSQDRLTGKWMRAIVQSNEKANIFPVKPDNRGDKDFIDNPVYSIIEEYKAAGALLPIAFGRFDCSGFNFTTDSADSEPRTSLKVSTLIDETLSDEDIQNELLQQALWETRRLNVTFFDEYGQVATYKNRQGEMALAVSTTDEQQDEKVAKAQDRRAKQLAVLAAIREKNGTKTETPVETEKVELKVFDLDAETQAFLATNPKASDEEITSHLDALEAEIEAHNTKIGAVEGAK
jgi:hypothetical protein